MAPSKLVTLTIHHSDGVTSHYPSQTTKVVASDGSFNYFREVQPEEAKDVLWRSKTARGLAESSAERKLNSDEEFIFKELPSNYRLYEQVKGKEGAGERKDTYLFGHPSGRRFRSPAEFLPHVLYLAKFPVNTDATSMPNITCSCVVCNQNKGVKGPNVPTAGKRAAGRRSTDPITQARRKVNAEERLHEQETAGWVLRKGELVWVWIPVKDSAEKDFSEDAGQWGAGIVLERPSTNTSLKKWKPQESGGFADIDMDDTPTWVQEANKTYTIQLCSETTAPEGMLSGVPQHHVRPWLTRRDCVAARDREHPSVEYGRRVAETFSLFDRSPDPLPSQRIAWGGFFLGAEKIFAGEPVRIASHHGKDDEEDVLVVEKISTASTHPAEIGSENSPTRKITVTYLQGSVYTCYPTTESLPITPQQFAELPFRMRRGSGNGEVIKWFIRNQAQERGELSLKMILGRWYEPEAVDEWIGCTGLPGGSKMDGKNKLQEKQVKIWKASRVESIGWEGTVNGIDLESGKPKGIDGEYKVSKVTLVNPPPAVETPLERDETPISSGFQSVNQPATRNKAGSVVSSGKKPEEWLKRKSPSDMSQDENMKSESPEAGGAILSSSSKRRALGGLVD